MTFTILTADVRSSTRDPHAKRHPPHLSRSAPVRRGLVVALERPRRGAGHPSHARNGRASAGPAGNVIEVTGHQRLRGRVVDSFGKPIAGAVVTALFAEQARFFDALSAADGTVTFGPFPRGPYGLVAQAPSLLPDCVRASEG